MMNEESLGDVPSGVVPEGYDASQFPTFFVTVDIVILAVDPPGELQVLLVRRRDEPYAGAWALPGGFKRPDETLDEAARRELREETSIAAPAHLTQFGAYGDPGRDPRGNIVTVGYIAVCPEVGKPKAGTDAAGAQMWAVDEALGSSFALAFDHQQILSDALEHARSQLEAGALAPAFVGPRFTLPELQSVFQSIWDEELDPANFRRSLLSDPASTYVIPTGDRGAAGAKGGRRPELFRAGETWAAGSPVKRSRQRQTPQADA